MIKQFVTAKDTSLRLSLVSEKVQNASEMSILIKSDKLFQKIIGFGGAFTEASAHTLNKMTPKKRKEVIKSYFDKSDGLGYNIGRVHIHSCDFALGNYTYVDDYDVELKSFSIEHDLDLIIPLIKECEEVSGESIELLASPWSPPAWMKTNNEMNHGGKLLQEYAQVWADYYIKFLEKYKEQGLTVSFLSVQNEPAATQVWDSCIYSGEEERDFVKNHLGPTLFASDYKDTKIVIWDHNRDILVERATAVLSDPEAAKYVWGTGIHWYAEGYFDKLTEVHNLFPDKHLIFTEGTQEGGRHPGSFKTGERYAANIIGDFSNYCEGFIDWNITLDEIGGPNHVGNFCDAPIICDTVTDEVIYNSSYYYIGHFSKFVMPGAYRIETENTNPNLKQIGFVNPDKSIVLIVLNETENDEVITLEFNEVKETKEIIKRSISTFIIGG